MLCECCEIARIAATAHLRQGLDLAESFIDFVLKLQHFVFHKVLCAVFVDFIRRAIGEESLEILY